MRNPDLHLHSYYSDGVDSPARVVERAKDKGIDVLAVTDHDGMDGTEEAAEAGKALGVGVVSGIEFTAELGIPLEGFDKSAYYMHILGYGMDRRHRTMKDALEFIKENRKTRNRALMEGFAQLGQRMSEKELLRWSKNDFVGKISFARVLTERGVSKDIWEAFASEKMLSHPEIKKIHLTKISAADAIGAINSSGGKAFLAHPFQLSYKGSKAEPPDDFRKRLRACILKMKELDLYGIECYYPTHSPEQTDYLISMAVELGLAVSRGSDDHGGNLRPVKVMGNFSTEADLSMLEWVKDYINVNADI